MQLRGPIQDPWPAIGRDSATIKFTLIAVGLCVSSRPASILVLRRRAHADRCRTLVAGSGRRYQPAVRSKPSVARERFASRSP